MLYIVTALKPEAQAFVDKYRLTKERLNGHLLFKNSNMMLIVSGVGVENAREATQTLINHFDITDDDIYLNVGICGATKSYEVGELLSISEINYDGQSYRVSNSDAHTLTCIDVEATTNEHEIVDMDSFGFYDAVRHSPAIKTMFILKVVSDHFEPHLITKEKTKALIFNTIDDINLLLFNKDEI